MKRLIIVLMALLFSGVASAAIKVACIGNSITYGTSIENPEVNSYPSQLQVLLGDNYIVGNFGKPGATLLRRGHRPYMQQEEFNKAMEFRGDIAVIHLGINDTDPRDWPNYGDDFIGDYLALIDSVKSANPKVRILIARMTPIRDTHSRFNSGTKQWHAQIQKTIETIAEISGCELIDFYEPMIIHPEFYNDVVHPSREGAAILADVVYRAITGNYGGLGMSPLYGDHMVLQRGRPVKIEGTDNAGRTVEVRFHGEKRTTVCGTNGHWEVEFPAVEDAMTGLKIRISDRVQTIEYTDVCIGEVWLCSGQSNMEFRLKDAVSGKEDIASSADEQLRLFHMKPLWATDNREWSKSASDSVNRMIYFHNEGWQHSTPESTSDFSAIAYHFGKALRDSLKVPVGIICNAVGGSTQESWIDRQTLENYLPEILKDWTGNDFTQEWCRQRAMKNLQNWDGRWKHHPYEPCYLFDTGIRSIGHVEIKGVIWYQGESNAHCAETYETLFGLFVDSWRKWFGHSDLPFIYAQLSSLDRPSWCWFRDTQRRLMDKLDNVGMAVTSDIGDEHDVHPRRKKEVGERMARWALNMQYGFSLTPSGPVVESASADGIIRFRFADGLRASDGEPRGFEVAGDNGIFFPAECTIDGDKVKVFSDNVSDIKYIRYGWKPYTDANLVNSEGLPTGTFRIETESDR